ncbi:MAG: hypothetical protein JWO78_2305 [Micavibrio sp.]|nr:hypothetical protein [Micavibrio sp.]
MPKPVFTIVDDFYNASWDLAESLFRLYGNIDEKNALQINVLENETPKPLTIPAIRQHFQKYADSFLALEGSDLPQDQHLPFMQIEETMNETILPGLDVLDEAWQDFNTSAFDYKLLLTGCSHIRIELEQMIIPNAKSMVLELKPA